MNSDEAKFVLRAYRPGAEGLGGRRVMHEALEQAHRDPALLEWLGRERAFDEAFSSRVAAVPAPAGLREAILIGVRATRQAKRSWWRSPAVLGVAAALVAAVGIPLLLGPVGRTRAPGAVAPEELALRVIADIDSPAHGHPAGPGVLALGEALGRHAGSLIRANDLDLSPRAVEAAGCRSFALGGHEVFEVCFARQGAWFHLYVVRSGGHVGSGASDTLAVMERRGFSVATWESAGDMYALATRGGAAALRTFL